MTQNTGSSGLFSNLTGATSAASTEDETKEVVSSGSTEEVEDIEEVGNDAPKDLNQLDMLKARAKTMGISFSPNIGVDALKAKIDAKMNGAATEPEKTAESVSETTEATTATEVVAAPVKRRSLRKMLHDEQMRLVRIRITNMDPKDANLPGGFYTFANEHLGTVRRYVPYGEASENGWHVPYCIFKMLRDAKFLQIKVTKVNGREVVEKKIVRKFALEELPALTTNELARLATAQAAAGSIDAN